MSGGVSANVIVVARGDLSRGFGIPRADRRWKRKSRVPKVFFESECLHRLVESSLDGMNFLD